MGSEAVSGVEAEVNKNFLPESPVNESESLFCRICHDSEEEEPFISPCRCKGSMGKMHKSCLERWLETSNRARCELCHYAYKLERRLRYKKWNTSICAWLVQGADRKRILYDCFLFSTFTPLMATIVYLSVSLSGTYETPDDLPLAALTTSGLAILCAAVLLTYIVWLGFVVRYHLLEWRQWWQNSFTVTVLPYVNRAPVRVLRDENSDQSITDAG